MVFCFPGSLTECSAQVDPTYPSQPGAGGQGPGKLAGEGTENLPADKWWLIGGKSVTSPQALPCSLIGVFQTGCCALFLASPVHVRVCACARVCLSACMHVRACACVCMCTLLPPTCPGTEVTKAVDGAVSPDLSSQLAGLVLVSAEDPPSLPPPAPCNVTWRRLPWAPGEAGGGQRTERTVQESAPQGFPAWRELWLH